MASGHSNNHWFGSHVRIGSFGSNGTNVSSGTIGSFDSNDTFGVCGSGGMKK